MGKTIKEIKERLGQKALEGMVHKRFEAADFKVDEEKGTIEAYVSIFNNVDLGGDKIIPGAFAESIAKKLPVGCWSHNWDEPIAKTIEAHEDEKGLYIKAKFIKGVQKADEAYLLLKEGVITEFSIGFRIQEHEYSTDEKENQIRIIKKIKLYEWSPVLAGMNPDTELIGVKDDGEKKEDAKIAYVKRGKRKVTVYFSDGSKKEFAMTDKYFKYLKTRDEKREKVEPVPEQQKILRIREAVKKIDQSAETILRITK